jgi:NAD(P)-dependent dehydrogenase (short-subunit alcohol dehydrogenase family)
MKEPSNRSRALLVGNSDGIGLAGPKRLLAAGWDVVGVSRSQSALALKPTDVNVTNVRFGVVDAKMAKGSFKPFMMSVEKAADCVESCIRTRPVSYAVSHIAVPLVAFRKLMIWIECRLIHGKRRSRCCR